MEKLLNDLYKIVNKEEIKNINITTDNIVEIELELKDLTEKDEVRLKIIKLVKIDHNYPGIKIDILEKEELFENNNKIKNEKIKYLAIASGKGGVGKSTVTANLALALSRLGKKVGIIDADIYGASIPFVLNMEVKPLDLDDDGMIIPARYDDIEVISTEFFMPKDKPLMWRGPIVSQMVNMYFESVVWDEDIEIILIDLPPGTGDVAIDVRQLVPKSEIIIVTNPNINASNVAVKAGLGSREIGHNILGVVENMSYYYNLCNNEKEYLFGTGGGQMVAEKLDVELLAQIPIGQPNENDTLYSSDTIQGKMFLMLAHKYLEIV